MSDQRNTVPRDLLFKAFNGDQRVVRDYEQRSQAIDATQVVAAGNAEATQALQDAFVLVLSPNATLNNETILQVGPGINAAYDAGAGTLTLTVDSTVVTTSGEQLVASKTLSDLRVLGAPVASGGSSISQKFPILIGDTVYYLLLSAS